MKISHAVGQQLTETSPISLERLLGKLGPNYSERTLRRWLSEWRKTGLITTTGKKRSTHYIFIKNDKLHEQEPTQIYFSHASQQILEQIKKPYALRTPVTYNPDWLQSYQPNKAVAIQHPYEQSLFLLTHIAYLQPFIDVNKRTSRLSANIPLINHNLVPLSFNDISQQDYTNAMIAIYELNDPRPLVDLYKYSYMRTALVYDVTVGAINFDPIRVAYRQQRREIIRHLIRHLISHQLDERTSDTYIDEEIKKFAKPEEVAHVLRNLKDDLRQLDPHNIAALGITNEQLKAWEDKIKAGK